MVIPLARELLRRGHEVLILPLSVAQLALEKTELPYITLPEALERAYPEPERQAILALGERLAETYHNPDSGIPRSVSAAYYGISMHCLLQEHGEAAWELFAQKGREAFCPVDFMRRLIQLEQPDIVTASCYVRMEKAGILAACELGIHSLKIWDTVVDEQNYTVQTADCQTAINELQKEFLISQGFPADRIFPTGQPAFDSLFNAGGDTQGTLRALGLDPGKKTVLWAVDGSPWVMTAFDEIQKAIRSLPQYNFIVKLHPTSNDERDFPVDASNAVLLKRYDIEQLLHTADLVISQISTVLQQAMILEKKVLSLRVYGDCPEEKWRQFEQAYTADMLRQVQEADTLSRVIQETLNDPQSEAPYEANRALYRPLRNGAKNICDCMESLCGTSLERT